VSSLELVLGDLAAEGAELDARVAECSARDWDCPTPAPGWTVRHQIAHLAWTDQMALLSLTEPQRLAELSRPGGADPAGFVDRAAEQGAQRPPGELLSAWRAGRLELAQRLAAADGRKLTWFGPPMSATSMATARLMETWAHGLDVAAGLGQPVAPTDRLWHVARLAGRTRDFAFRLHGLPVPAEEFWIDLSAPDGRRWTFGPADAAQRVTGSAWDFCRLAVQRCNRDEVGLRAEGAEADRWLDIIQAFAGPPGPGRGTGR